MRENAPMWSHDPISEQIYTQKVLNHYISSQHGHVWGQIKGNDELIMIFLTRTRWDASTLRHSDFKVLSSRSNINDNYRIHLHFIGRVPRYMWWHISRFISLPSLHQQSTRAMMTHRGRLLKTISAALLHCFLGLNTDHVTWWLIAEESSFGRLSH